MVGGTPLSPPLGVGAVVELVPVPVPMVLADMVVGWTGGAVGTVGGAVGIWTGTGFTWLVAEGNTVEVWWVRRVEVFWEGPGGSVSMAAVSWKSGCSRSEGSQYPRLKLLVTAMREVALVRKVPGCVGSV